MCVFFLFEFEIMSRVQSTFLCSKDMSEFVYLEIFCT
jgi:hypothetical protein